MTFELPSHPLGCSQRYAYRLQQKRRVPVFNRHVRGGDTSEEQLRAIRLIGVEGVRGKIIMTLLSVMQPGVF